MSQQFRLFYFEHELYEVSRNIIHFLPKSTQTLVWNDFGCDNSIIDLNLQLNTGARKCFQIPYTISRFSLCQSFKYEKSLINCLNHLINDKDQL